MSGIIDQIPILNQVRARTQGVLSQARTRATGVRGGGRLGGGRVGGRGLLGLQLTDGSLIQRVGTGTLGQGIRDKFRRTMAAPSDREPVPSTALGPQFR